MNSNVNPLIEEDLFDLEKFLQEESRKTSDPQDKGYVDPFERLKIKDLSGAMWFFRKLQTIYGKVNEINAVAKAEIEHITTWQDKEVKSLQSTATFFEELIKRYYIQEKAQDKKFKLTTPYGKVKSRKMADKWEVDKTTLLLQLEINKFEELIKREPLLKLEDLKEKAEVKFNVVIDKDSNTVLEGVTAIVEEHEDELSKYTEIKVIDSETGEILDPEEYIYLGKAVIYRGAALNGVKVTPQDDKITVEVEGQ
jgi:hypothetical protein